MTQQVEKKMAHAVHWLPVEYVQLWVLELLSIACNHNVICHVCAIGSTTICKHGASSCHTTWISKNATNTKQN